MHDSWNYNSVYTSYIYRVEKNKFRIKWGIFLMALASILFLMIPVVPFLNLEGKTKITLSTILFILGEITFWAGGFLVGKELFTKYKSYLDPRRWFVKQNKIEED